MYKTLWALYRLQFKSNHFQTSYASCGWWEEKTRRHFRLLLWNWRKVFAETRQKAKIQWPLLSSITLRHFLKISTTLLHLELLWCSISYHIMYNLNFSGFRRLHCGSKEDGIWHIWRGSGWKDGHRFDGSGIQGGARVGKSQSWTHQLRCSRKCPNSMYCIFHWCFTQQSIIFQIYMCWLIDAQAVQPRAPDNFWVQCVFTP